MLLSCSTTRGLNATIEVISNGVLLDTFKDSVPLKRPLFFKKQCCFKIIIQVASFKEQKIKNSNSVLTYLSSDIQLVLVGEGF
jgi:hypothetical protein